MVPSLTARSADCLADLLALPHRVHADRSPLRAELEQAGIPAFVVGRITEGDHPVLIRNSGEHVHITAHVEDELWRFFARAEEGN